MICDCCSNVILNFLNAGRFSCPAFHRMAAKELSKRVDVPDAIEEEDVAKLSWL